MKASDAIKRLKAIGQTTGTEAERELARQEAQNVMMLSVPVTVRDAYSAALVALEKPSKSVE